MLDERAQYHNRIEDYQAILTRALRKYKDSQAYWRVDSKPLVYLYQVAAKLGLTPADFTALKDHPWMLRKTEAVRIENNFVKALK